MTQSRIEPATFRFVAQHLNHCATALPTCLHNHISINISLLLLPVLAVRRMFMETLWNMHSSGPDQYRHLLLLNPDLTAVWTMHVLTASDTFPKPRTVLFSSLLLPLSHVSSPNKIVFWIMVALKWNNDWKDIEMAAHGRRTRLSAWIEFGVKGEAGRMLWLYWVLFILFSENRYWSGGGNCASKQQQRRQKYLQRLARIK